MKGRAEQGEEVREDLGKKCGAERHVKKGFILSFGLVLGIWETWKKATWS